MGRGCEPCAEIIKVNENQERNGLGRKWSAIPAGAHTAKLK